MNIVRDGAESSLTWFKSSYSNGAGGECVECAVEGGRILLCDTKIGHGLVTDIGAPAWHVFTHAVGQGWTEAP